MLATRIDPRRYSTNFFTRSLLSGRPSPSPDLPGRDTLSRNSAQATGFEGRPVCGAPQRDIRQDESTGLHADAGDDGGGTSGNRGTREADFCINLILPRKIDRRVDIRVGYFDISRVLIELFVAD